MGLDFFSYNACCFFFISSKASTAIDIISPPESQADGKTLVSSDGTFALGFFSPGSSNKRFHWLVEDRK
ncbi:hypothetical protein V6N13_085164 [Hibiscus sabdariffa]|uniref:Uncharacterized protein n=1 Tax=Hibiscus sabdariffa TaxID=183260 RepID=A0ABR2D139_9ROSI